MDGKGGHPHILLHPNSSFLEICLTYSSAPPIVPLRPALCVTGTHGNAVSRPAISAFWRSQERKSAFFLWERSLIPRPER